MLMESHGLDEEALNALCREKGVFRHHLEQWQAAFIAGGSAVIRTELRELKVTNKALTRELNRKEKALAEAAALLVLKKSTRRCGWKRTHDFTSRTPTNYAVGRGSKGPLSQGLRVARYRATRAAALESVDRRNHGSSGFSDM